MSDIQIFIRDKDNEGEWRDIDEGLLDLSSHDEKVRNKAIDDFARGLDYLLVKYTIENTLEPNIENVKFSLSYIKKIVSRVIEQLKAGGNNEP